MAYVFSYRDVFVKQQRGTVAVINSFVPYNAATDVSHFRRQQFFTNTTAQPYRTVIQPIYSPPTPVVQSSDVFIGWDTFPFGWPDPVPTFSQQQRGYVNFYTPTFVYNEAKDARRIRQDRFLFVEPGVFIKPQNYINLSFITPIGPALTTVPDETGVAQAIAVTDFSIFGLGMIVVGSQYDNVNPVGSISAQNPVGGSTALIGSNVQVIISLGPTPPPPFPGITLPDAIFIAINAGLVVGQPIVWQYDPVIPYNYVISQTPPAGSVIPQQSVVKFVVSLGPAPTAPGSITVNDYTGMMILDAQQQALNDGLSRSNSVVWQYSTVVQNQYVISQSIVPGTVVPFGTAIVFTVSAGYPSTTLPGATVITPTMH